MMGRAAGHSGTGNGVFSNDIQGDVEGFTYAIQGNILTGAAVLDQAQMAFQGEACDLAERLMRALEAGALNNQGDRRCTPAGAPSDSAFIEVDRPGEPAGSYLRLSVVAPGEPTRCRRCAPSSMPGAAPTPAPTACPRPRPPRPADAGADGGGADPRRDAGSARAPPGRQRRTPVAAGASGGGAAPADRRPAAHRGPGGGSPAPAPAAPLPPEPAAQPAAPPHAPAGTGPAHAGTPGAPRHRRRPAGGAPIGESPPAIRPAANAAPANRSLSLPPLLIVAVDRRAPPAPAIRGD